MIEKNFKAGDKVDGASSGTLAVIYDPNGCASCATVCPDGCITVYKVKQQ